MRAPPSDVSSGRLQGRAGWVHLGIRLEADQLDEAELLAAMAEHGAHAVVERCAGGDGLRLRLRIEPAEPLSVLAAEQSGEAATDASPSEVHRPRPETGNSARVRRTDHDDPDDVRAVMSLAAGILSFVGAEDAPPAWLWTPGEPAWLYEDENGTARLALARSQSSFSTLADKPWLDSLEPAQRVGAFRVLLEAATRGSSKATTAVPLIFTAHLFAFADDLRSAGVIGRPVCQLSVAVVSDHVERVS